MKIISDINHQTLPPSVATIGFFDGVHRGHRFLINQVKEVAAKDGLYSALITFPVHPRQVIQTAYRPQLLSSPTEKLELLETMQVDYCFLLPFTQELSLFSAREFMQLLRNKFNIHTLVIGYDHRFGHNRSENFEDYCRYGEELNIYIVRARAYTDKEGKISSSVIRQLLKEGEVSIYVCGPTVYNLIHIGNARPMIIFDTFRRYLEYKGYDVNYVSNFTDVDDKIIKKAIEEGTTAEEISQRYIKECKKDMHDLNIEPATTHPLATQEIDGMIEMIKTLIDKGYAYDADGTVYYRTRKFKDYGKLSKKNIDDLEAGHRDIKVAGEESKEDPLDFVLWKPKKEGEPSWPSPWSDGRPGWHIECSVMSKKYLGDEIDIHAGGEDLIFPHHENEIAQSEAANGCEFSKYWMHNGFLNINNKKMSKSLGNFFTVRDISEKYDLQVLRFFMLSAHYRSPLNFSDDLMESAKNGLERIITSGAKIRDIISNGKDGKVTDAEAKLLDEAKEYITKFEEAMDDDCNTANAISAVFELVKFANSNLNEGSTKEFAAGVYEILDKLCNVLGIILEKEEEKVGDEDYIEEMIAKRAQAKKDRDFAMADQIRDELAAKGIVLKDTREGTKWSRA